MGLVAEGVGLLIIFLPPDNRVVICASQAGMGVGSGLGSCDAVLWEGK